MKYRALAIISVLFFSTIHSQDYRPMLVEGAVWNEVFYFENADPQSYIVGGDTVLNNLTYKKILSYSNNSGVGGLIGLMREDSIERKIYLLDDYDQAQEELLYDFSLEVGDFFGDLRLDSISNELNVFESEIISFNLNTRFFYFSVMPGDNYYKTWIEGLGSNNGLFRASNAEYLLCHNDENGFLDLSIDPNLIGVENCLLLNVNNIPDLIEGELYPNPASTSLCLALQEYIKNGEVKISDITGKTVKAISFFGETIDINIQDINSGMFILQVYDSGNLIGIRKFVKI